MNKIIALILFTAVRIEAVQINGNQINPNTSITVSSITTPGAAKIGGTLQASAGVNISGSLTVNGSSITAKNIVSIGSVTANMFFGNGSALTGLSGGISGSGTNGKVVLWNTSSSLTTIGSTIALSGTGNTVTGTDNMIGAGNTNSASGNKNFIGAGGNNSVTCIDDEDSVFGRCGIVAGSLNSASGSYNFIGAGESNTISSNDNVIGGGASNTANGTADVVGGGVSNTASAQDSVVVGGTNNQATGQYSMVLGGDSNRATGLTSFASGRFARSNHTGAWIWADNTETSETFPSNVANEFAARARGGFRFVVTGATVTINSTGTLTAPSFSGNGSGLTGINTSSQAIYTTDFSGSNQLFQACVGTLTVTTDGGPYRLIVSGNLSDSDAGATASANIFQDGNYISPWSSTAAMMSAGNGRRDVNFNYYFTPGAGSHSWCLSFKAQGSGDSWATVSSARPLIFRVESAK